MLTILLHSSKTMRDNPPPVTDAPSPQMLAQATELARYVSSLTTGQLESSMKISPHVAKATAHLFADWNVPHRYGFAAIDAFTGDIYSGLQVSSLSKADRAYAHQRLIILSGLYGCLRALDVIQPYRLEMGYKFPDKPYDNLYTFWGDTIARQLPDDQDIINLSAVEYTRAVLPYLPSTTQVITPKFLTVSAKTGEPAFVTVHAKIARGAFAHWLLTHRITAAPELIRFNELGYRYDAARSTPTQPVFICHTFGGLGMSVRQSS